MKILHIAPLEETVPPEKYGGTELVVSNIVDTLVDWGHDVYLMASGDSKTKANLIPICDKSIRKNAKAKQSMMYRDNLKYMHMPQILEKLYEIEPDIVHNHMGWRLAAFANLIPYPLFHTHHGPLTSAIEKDVLPKQMNSFHISISDNQRKAISELNWVGTVYNGINVDKFEIGSKSDRNYFVFLGRASPEKGLKEICEMIKKTNYKLKIAAKVDLVDKDYFEQEVKPLVDGRQIEYLGEVDHLRKVELLKQAKGLLLWLNWEEPFGLVVVEAMACGTPVIVNKRGAMPEVVMDGVTGYLVNDLEEMKERLDKVQYISPYTCRRRIVDYFSTKAMTKGYMHLYQEVLEFNSNKNEESKYSFTQSLLRKLNPLNTPKFLFT